jgi:hypothetical protein
MSGSDTLQGAVVDLKNSAMMMLDRAFHSIYESHP